MTRKSYRWIIALLSVCIFSILLLQFYGFKQLYQQRKDLFDLKVYETLESISTKINDLNLVELFKSNYELDTKNDSTKISGNSIRISRSKRLLNRDSTERFETQVFVNDKAVLNGKDTLRPIKKLVSEFVIESKLQRDDSLKVLKLKTRKHSQNILDSTMESQLLERMFTELQLLDVNTNSPEKNSKIIKQELELKGLDLEFDYRIELDSLGIRKPIVSSKGFERHQPFYEINLSAKKIIKRNRFLLLQFPEINTHILGGMKAGILITGIFILIISVCYYYIIRLILNQKKLAEMKTDFINNITHELKTPIATASLAIDAIKGNIETQNKIQIYEYLEIVKFELAKLNSHVERVMQIALMDQTKSAYNFRILILEDLLTESIQHHQLQIKELNAQLQFESIHQKTLLFGDKDHLVNAFNNLLDNALKYSKANCQIKISIQCEKLLAKIIIQDNGIGIAENEQSKIFEKFYRVSTGNLHFTKGFGIGLSYTKMVIEAHGGNIKVESRRGEGSRFIILLPIHEK